jgi:glycerophosphoryl diester phosphodiesterase
MGETNAIGLAWVTGCAVALLACGTDRPSDAEQRESGAAIEGEPRRQHDRAGAATPDAGAPSQTQAGASGPKGANAGGSDGSGFAGDGSDGGGIGSGPDEIPELRPATGPAVIAHRGASGHAPEHTLVAYDLALAMGADYIEQDIGMTADGVLVCLHDSSLNRTARGAPEDCSGALSDKTLSQVQRCDMGSWVNEARPERAKPEYVGLAMPSLNEVFARYGSDANYYIEIKALTGDGSVEQELIRLINAYGLREGAVTRRQVLVQSFAPDSLSRMHELDPEIPLIQLLSFATSAQVTATAQQAFGIGPSLFGLNRALIDSAHALGLAVHPFTVDESAELQRIAGMCVDGMFTNFPDRYRALLDSEIFDCPPAKR